MVYDDQLVDAPILKRIVGQVSPDNDGDLALLQLLHGNLQGIGLSLEFDHDRRAHRNLQGPRAQNSGPLVLRHVLGGYALVFGHAAPRLSGGYYVDVVGFLFVLLQVVDVLVVHVLVEVVSDIVGIVIIVCHVQRIIVYGIILCTV